MTGTPTPVQVTPAMRWLLIGGVALVTLAAIPLFFFSEHTDQYFAWTIRPPLTAAFLGAGYWAVACTVVLALREREWTRIRVIVPAFTLGVTLILLATLLHLDRFHLSSPIFTAQVWAWAWLILYVALVVALVAALWQQRQVTGVELPYQRKLHAWLRYALAVLGLAMLLIGVSLIVVPASMGALWPWPLTPLTSRMVGAWFTALGVALMTASRENDYARTYLVGVTGIVYAGLQLVNLARYPATVQWTQPGAWVYLAILMGLVVVSVANLRGYIALRSRQVDLLTR
jgi:hypothetical protein